MIRLALAASALAVAMPAAAVTIVQTRNIQLGTLDLAAISQTVNFASFASFNVVGEHLQSVMIELDARANGTVDATNNASGGNAASRRRNITASYTLNSSVAGNGLSVSGTNTDSQTRTNVPGLGTTVTLNGINPRFTATDSITSGFAPFLGGQVHFAFDADALFASVPTSNVVFGSPEITGGRAIITLTYTSVIPEPATWALLIVGFGSVGVAVRRRSVPA